MIQTTFDYLHFFIHSPDENIKSILRLIPTTKISDDLQRKWRLILGPEAEENSDLLKNETDQKQDQALTLLFENASKNQLKRSRPRLNDWLRDIRDLFTPDQVLFLQKEAIESLDLKSLLFEKETIQNLTPDIELIKTILLLKDQIPEENLVDVKNLVKSYAEEIEEKIEWGIKNSFQLHHEKGDLTYHPRRHEIDWKKTIKKNLRHFQPDLNTILINQKMGYEKRRHGFPEIFLVVDSSASMSESMIYSAIIASVLAHIRTINTRLILFDSDFVDLTEQLNDVVELLFNIQLGGGTNIVQPLMYMQNQIRNSDESYLFLISDLFDNFDDQRVYDILYKMAEQNIETHCILSMDQQGKSHYNKPLAQQLTNSGIPCYSSSPDQFGDTLQKALNK